MLECILPLDVISSELWSRFSDSIILIFTLIELANVAVVVQALQAKFPLLLEYNVSISMFYAEGSDNKILLRKSRVKCGTYE